MDYEVKNIYKKTTATTAQVEVTGSKSITARALLLAALARGESVLYNAQFSDDCAVFLQCLKELGINCSVDGTTVKIDGCGGVLPKKSAKICVGSAGTAARFLTALCAFSDGEFVLDSSDQMKKRPIAPLISSLESAGAQIISENNTFPLRIKGARFDSGKTTAPRGGAAASKKPTEIIVDVTQSSQFLSAILMSAVCLDRPVHVKPVGSHGAKYVEMTLDMMWSFGVTVCEEGGGYTVSGSYAAKKYDIEPDLSAASYFYAAGRILGVDVKVRGVMPHSMQADGKFISLIKNFDGGTVDMGEFSDQALTLAAVAPYFSEPTTITGVEHIRKQECDRIRAMAENLSAMGVPYEEFADGIKIYPAQPRPAVIKTFGDHRVAMSFALTGLRADGIVIQNAEVCSKTFSAYFDVLTSLISALTR